MGKDRANKGTQQTRMDQYTAQNARASLQKDPPGPSEKGAEPTGAQILAVIESSSQATQTQIAAIAVDVNLLRADLRVLGMRGYGLVVGLGPGQCGEPVNPPVVRSLVGNSVHGPDNWWVWGVLLCSPDLNLAIEQERRLFPLLGTGSDSGVHTRLGRH
ncbi:hypothetical protein NDU88_006885 [Pleurodeles waltl]|uniref:Uncharacterized protein n=1 Tax=Pleurodeles waltl TaxID=8319 RepID=A0AAV7QKC4_PLEWA|nr:hypothetical protein NDU88_006885 [Pleurodeles waltl]